MKLINRTQNKIITKNLQIKNSLIQKSIGLIGTNKIQSIYFSTRWGIHTFGVKKPLTIIICSKIGCHPVYPDMGGEHGAFIPSEDEEQQPGLSGSSKYSNSLFQIQQIKSQLSPNQLFFYNPKYQHIFELPYKKYPVKIGDILEIKN